MNNEAFITAAANAREEIKAMYEDNKAMREALEFYAQLTEQYRGVKLNSIAVKTLKKMEGSK